MSNFDDFKLNEIEASHFKEISGEARHHLALVDNAAAISLNGLMVIKNPPTANSPKGLILFLLARAAKNIRFASLGVKMGYYGGAYGAIRSSLEALSYAALFESYPEEVNQAFIHDFAQQPDDYVIKARNDQLKRAKDALLDLENDRLTIKDGLKEFLQKANPFIHTSLRGLAEEFGIDVSYLLPDDFQQEFEKTGGDFSKALNRYKLLNKFGSNMLASKNLENHPEDELIQIELVGRCDKLMIEDLALFAFYIAHRILDTTRELFEIDSSDFHENYNAWHNAVKELGDLR